VFTHLRRLERFPIDTARFYSGQVIFFLDFFVLLAFFLSSFQFFWVSFLVYLYFFGGCAFALVLF
jgi:hypothetical protein